MKADVHECVTFSWMHWTQFFYWFRNAREIKIKVQNGFMASNGHNLLRTCENEFNEVQREMQNLVFNIFLNILKASQHFGLTSIIFLME